TAIVKQVATFTAAPNLRFDVIQALNNFYFTYIEVVPVEARAFFRRLVGECSLQYASDMTYNIQGTTTPVASITAFIKEQIRTEHDGKMVEFYHYYLRKTRRLEDADAPWITQWIQSGHPTYGLLSYLLNGDLHFDVKAHLFVQLNAANARYRNPN